MLTLDTWECRFEGQHDWQPIAVPGCWEALGAHKLLPGPVWYRTNFSVPTEWSGQRLWLRFGGVSYHCVVSVNGQVVGQHIGMWDSFAIEITDAVAPGQTAEVVVQVEKPAGPTRGPSSAYVPGRFPLRETLAGFLPYVWGHVFGGIWQSVTLEPSGPVVFEDVHVRGQADGAVEVMVDLDQFSEISISISDPDGMQVYQGAAQGQRGIRCSTQLPNPQPWSPREPRLYTARVRLLNGDERVVRFGLRSVEVDGSSILLNGLPLHVRMVLSWGWYPDVLHSNPGPERVRADMLRLKALGYNGVKLCLWFPPSYYFYIADELGMLLWVELPMWLPNPTPFFREQTPLEYERLVRQARNHPSVILYTLGCELNRSVGSDLLAPLFEMVKRLGGDALVRDNSGSGEAYGGLLDEHAEFYDYHFYSDLQFYRALIDQFSPRWRATQPWLFGEFCDADTFRDLRRLSDGDQLPWWTSADQQVNPQGARWQYEIVHQQGRLQALGLWERGAELERLSEQQALIYRKYVLELMRTYREIGGYVITGERDTPISTPGMWDELDRLKHAPDEFRSFNDDLVVLVGWGRRRAWLSGGDRIAPWDTWSYTAGAPIRAHLIASHYGRSSGPAEVRWTVGFAEGAPFASGQHTTANAIRPGDLRELTVAEWISPDVPQPRRATLRATLTIGDEQTTNSWPLWCFPRDYWNGLDNVFLFDPLGRLRDLRQIAQQVQVLAHPERAPRHAVVLATLWTPELDSFVAGGGRALLLQAAHHTSGPCPTVELPFWREALRLAEPHPAWRDFPTEELGLQLYGCATDVALDTRKLNAKPILRRLDMRAMHQYDYAVEVAWGRGRLLVSTLRFEGGAGDQPLGISRNTAAAYLLQCWLRYLREAR
jgi:hypothetical protein